MTTPAYKNLGIRDALRKLTDSELMKKISEEDGIAFEILRERHNLRILAFVQRKVQDSDLAEDVVQEIFLKVYEHRHNFRLGASFVAWINTIAGNKVKNVFRWRNNHSHVSNFSDFVGFSGASRTLEFPDLRPGPAEDIEGNELRERLDQELRVLPEQMREAVELRDIEEKSYLEMAETMQVCMGTVKSRISRGRKALREPLASHR